MRRRRRKINPHPAGRRRILLEENHCRPDGVAINPLRPVRLVALLVLHLFIMPQLVNLTESSMLPNRSETNVTHGSATRATPRNQFDDEPTDGQNVVDQILQSVAIKSDESGPSLISEQSKQDASQESRASREISTISTLVSKQLNSSETSHIRHLDQPDDLLAVESSPVSSSPLAHQQRLSSEAPYETGRNLSHPSQSEVHHQHTSNRTGQALSIQAIPSLTPIYLKHQLPATLRTPQLVAFPHPASTRGQLDSDGKPVEGDERRQTFALLPSWPNIYITQREQAFSPATGAARETAPAQTDPKVPTNYPNWSKAHDQDRLINSEVEYDDHVKASANSSDSSNKQKSQDRPRGEQQLQQHLWIEDGSGEELKRQHHRDRSRQLLADSWAKLLEQAAKNNAMESLMLTNRSIVSLLCDKDEMLVKFKFKRPFYGLVETNLNPEHRCRVSGNGSQYYELRIDLYDCGTRREMSRLFINNIQIRFQNPTNDSRATFSQQEADSTLTWADGEADSSEFKTLICSYPTESLRSPTISHTGRLSEGDELSSGMYHQREESKFVAGVKSSGAEHDQSRELSGQSGLPPSKGRPFERIVDSERPDEADRLSSYGTILMGVALFLLMLTTLLLCLITSVYVSRRKRRLASEQSPETDRQPATRLKSANENTLGRLYNLAPAQMANRVDAKLQPIAPPLIGLKPSKRRLGGNFSSDWKGPDGADPGRPLGSMAKNPEQLKNKQKQMMIARRNGSGRHSNSEADQNMLDISEENLVTSRHSRVSSEFSDQSLQGRTSSSELSVTTIEIPYAKNRDPPKEISTQTIATSGSQLIRNASTQSRIKPEIKKVDVELQTELPSPPLTAAPLTEVVHEEIQTTSHERVVERTSHIVQVQQADDGSSTMGDKGDRSVRQSSPVLFGSFRARLTSPNDYRRLKYIVQLFEFDDGRNMPQLNPASKARFDRYRMKILKVMSPSERAQLRRLLNEDEAFRSNVVDSIDVETFNRKLRNNRMFDTHLLSKEAWDLFGEILLDSNISKAQATLARASDSKGEPNGQRVAPAMGIHLGPIEKSTTPTKPPPERSIQAEREFSQLKIKSVKRTQSPAATIQSAEPETKREALPGRTASKAIERPQSTRSAAGERKSSCDNATTRQIQVSQSNSTHCDGNARFNFDTVTSISSPTHFSAFTRSSFDLKQVTKFSEDYPFPYMDE